VPIRHRLAVDLGVEEVADEVVRRVLAPLLERAEEEQRDVREPGPAALFVRGELQLASPPRNCSTRVWENQGSSSRRDQVCTGGSLEIGGRP